VYLTPLGVDRPPDVFTEISGGVASSKRLGAAAGLLFIFSMVDAVALVERQEVV